MHWEPTTGRKEVFIRDSETQSAHRSDAQLVRLLGQHFGVCLVLERLKGEVTVAAPLQH